MPRATPAHQFPINSIFDLIKKYLKCGDHVAEVMHRLIAEGDARGLDTMQVDGTVGDDGIARWVQLDPKLTKREQNPRPDPLDTRNPNRNDPAPYVPVAFKIYREANADDAEEHQQYYPEADKSLIIHAAVMAYYNPKNLWDVLATTTTATTTATTTTI